MDDLAFLLAVLAALAAVGAFAGLIAGLLGIGGGIVIVPALWHVGVLFGVAEVHRMHVAVGTSLAVIVLTSLVSMRAHRRHGAVDGAILRAYGPGVLAGVLAGAAIAAVVSGAVLTAVFAVAALAVSINMALGDRARRLGTRLPGRAATTAFGLLTGSVSTLAGIGGGAMTVAILTLYSVPIHLAVGTSAAVGAIVSVPGAAGFAAIGWSATALPPLSLGYVNLAAFAAIAPTAALTAPYGARLAHRLPRLVLARVFAAFLGIAAAHMLWSLWG